VSASARMAEVKAEQEKILTNLDLVSSIPLPYTS